MKLRSLSTSEVNDDWRRRHAALSAGFEIVSRGEDGVRNALDRLALEANNGRDTPKAAFGQLYGKLSIDFVKDPAFTVFRTILRDCILDHWEYAGTEVVLGEPVGRRHFHSLLSASKETGFSPRVLNNYLVEAGVLDANDPRPEPRRLFDAIKYADLLKTLPALVGPIEMQSAMGATRREGVPDEGWETINLAAKRKKVGVNAVIDAIRAGAVTVGVEEDQRGYNAIRILMTSVDHWHARHGKEAKPEGAMSVAEFARSVGQHNNRYFLKLFETGHASAMSAMHPVTRRKQRRMTDQQIAAFREKFATTGTQHSELGLSKKIILDTIRAAGIQEFSSDGQNFGQVWLRKDVIHLFASEDRRRAG
ncbi:hypothetical protein [Martelella radicis]|uniref:Uncharacterized protein n=1 Tax=Martelella radicis TaxID=1397476 RepID=A0A7W6P9L4_9HYPH|nr:hypothetical protein [Martelella radicis]MBB4120654.1 hypothetical protein [Martelella radicis]